MWARQSHIHTLQHPEFDTACPSLLVNYELSRAFNDVHRFPARHQAGAGDIVALAGVDCESGVTFTDGKAKVTLGNSELLSNGMQAGVK